MVARVAEGLTTSDVAIDGMLDDGTWQALAEARHGDPFAVLGQHADAEGRLWLRACLPGAQAVQVLDAASGRALCAMEVRQPALCFEAIVPRRRKAFAYRLSVQWAAGGPWQPMDDPYGFGPQLAREDLQALASGQHLRPWQVLGAHLQRVDGVAGTRFAVWAPNAHRVSVVGSFNQWDGRRHPMRRYHEAGVWELFIPAVQSGDLYQFEILGAEGQVLRKADPYARQAQFRPDTASIVCPEPPQMRLPVDRRPVNRRDAPISIYEVHAPSWRRPSGGGPGDFVDWDTLAATLPGYAAGLGFTHIELLPIAEHPFDGSWGYQTLGLYAPTARLGDPRGLARFVAACHAQGLGVLLDWVPAHFPADAHGLVQFDGTHCYEYADPREGFHRDWNTLIYHFGRLETQQFLVGNALYWLEQWGVDGLRVDAVASMLYRDYSRPAGEWVPNVHGGRENLEAIAFLRRMNEVIGAEAPGGITVAEESTSFPGVSAPTSAGGLGFHYKWNMGWMNDTLRYMQEDPIHRKWHHEKISFGLVYAFSENFVLPISHDEVVHGKGSMLGKMPGDAWQRFAHLRAYYGFMWGHPGKKLLFMGQEFAQPTEWNHDGELPWGLLDDPAHAGVQVLIRDLNRVYRERPSLHRQDCEAEGFQWLVSEDRDHSVFAWLRREAAGDQTLVVCNFTPVPREGYRIPMPPGPRAWREVINTDASYYGGSNLGNQRAVLPVVDGHLHLLLPPLATLMLEPVEEGA